MTGGHEPLTWNEKALALLLRLAACFLLLAVFAIFLPFSWMDAIHAWLGMGELPDRPIVGYLARSLSAFYAFHGVIIYFLARDVRRYGPLIRGVAAGSLVFGLLLLVLDAVEGMPLFWVVFEGPSVMALGAVLLWLQGKGQGPRG